VTAFPSKSLRRSPIFSAMLANPNFTAGRVIHHDARLVRFQILMTCNRHCAIMIELGLPNFESRNGKKPIVHEWQKIDTRAERSVSRFEAMPQRNGDMSDRPAAWSIE